MLRRCREAFFVLVLLLGSVRWLGAGDEISTGDGWASRLLPVLGLAVGFLWQLVYRRDLADRLLLPALSVVLGTVLGSLFGQTFITVSGVLLGGGLLSGLVLTEHWLRRRSTTASVTEVLGASISGTSDPASAPSGKAL